jgi:hypothetical protein
MLLRNKRTGNFFQGVADWTKDLTKAFDFRSPERVARFVLAASLDPKDMELVLGFGDPRYNLALPIDGRYGVRGLQQDGAPASDSRWPISVSPPQAAPIQRQCVSLET